MRIQTSFAAMVVVIAVTGCSVAPILNVSEAPAINASGKSLSREQVRGAIVRAGAALGWQMKDEGANMLVGTIQLGGSIHKNYNGWIQNLTRGINAQLSAS